MWSRGGSLEEWRKLDSKGIPERFSKWRAKHTTIGATARRPPKLVLRQDVKAWPYPRKRPPLPLSLCGIPCGPGST